MKLVLAAFPFESVKYTSKVCFVYTFTIIRYLYYRTRFQIEFCFRDAKGYTGLMDCQARDKWKLDFAFNASFTSLNVAKVTMKEMGMEYSMSSFKSLMTNIYLVKRIFKASGYTPNRTLISKIFKDLSCLQRIAA